MDAAASGADGIAGRDKLRERFSGRKRTVPKRTAKACGPDASQWQASSLAEVLQARPGWGAGFRGATEATKAIILRGECVISRQAIAQGMSDVLRCPVCSCAHLLLQFAHETAGAARIRHSLLPHLRENDMQTSGKSCRENADVYLVFEMNCNSHHVIASAAKQSISPPAPLRNGLLRCARNDVVRP